MRKMEKLVWAAAFAAEFTREHAKRRSVSPYVPVSGIECAEIAERAVEKFRDAILCEEGQFFMPKQEKWV